MALRSGHGSGRGQPHVEVLPPDEQPQPVPAPVAAPSVPLARRKDGKIADSETAKALGKKGGITKARRVRLVDSLGLKKIADDATFKPYRDAAEEFVSHHLAELAKSAGGAVGPGPSTMVASAALQLAASRWAFDKGAEENDAALIKLGSSLANDSRQNLLAAFEMATREAAARPRSGAMPWLDAGGDEGSGAK
ncbi:MAG TPA: hypothetical protein VK841_22445 [Polyangiaceae bacterium]|jgi:hypothetical protein|nr:hypothetical protein [Polyangiaceae bacterium]